MEKAGETERATQQQPRVALGMEGTFLLHVGMGACSVPHSGCRVLTQTRDFQHYPLKPVFTSD